MARGKQVSAIEKRKAELSEQLEASRIAMAYGKDALKESLNVKKKVGRVVQQNQSKVVMGGAMLAGLVGSTILRRRSKAKESQKKRTIGGFVKGLIVGAIMKKAKAVALDKAKQVVIQKIQSRYMH